MSKHHLAKVVPSYEQKRSLTHFLAIPLISPASKSHVRDAITRLLDEPSLAAVSRHDFRPLGTLHLRLGAMNLTTPDRFKKSTSLLQNLDFKCILNMAAERSSNKNISVNVKNPRPGFTLRTVATHSAATKNIVTPVSVSLHGLHSGKVGIETATSKLSADVVDSTNRLKDLIDAIRKAYHDAGLLDLRLSTCRETARLAQEKRNSSIFGVTLLRPRNPPGFIPSRAHPGRVRSPPLPRYDLSQLIRDFEHKSWSDPIRLERVSICPLGVSSKIQRQGGGLDSDMGLDEVFSVPLP